MPLEPRRHRSSHARRRSLLVALVTLGLVADIAFEREAAADAPRFDATDVARVVSIRRSLNHNRVDYGVRLDAECRAEGRSPVFAYWRMLEDGDRLESLLPREEPAYGIARQATSDTEAGSRIVLTLRAVRDRPIVVRTRRAERGCVAEGTMTIAGVEAHVSDIFVALAGGFRIDHVEIRGRAVSDRRPVEESLRP